MEWVVGGVVLLLLIGGIVLAVASIRQCSDWERKVVLRFGRFAGARGPGLFFLLPFIETTPFTIDVRENTSSFSAEQTLTKDGASVAIDAIVYWRVSDAGQAATRLTDYRQAVLGAAQGALRDIIGRNDLATLLSQRREIDSQLTAILDEQTETWGIKVLSVQMQDIKVPEQLQDVFSRMAQAERERQARQVLGESEVAVARLFAEAGAVYAANPTALHLRGMNMLYETLRTGAATVVLVPSSALETMNLGALAPLATSPGAADAGRLVPPKPIV